MEQFIRMPLSESTNGEGLHQTDTSAPGQLVHTAPTQGYDLVWIYAGNVHTASLLVVVEWTGFGASTDAILTSVPKTIGQLQIPIVNGLLLRGGAEVRINPTVTAVINIFGYVERYE